jgi:hypothetical protein
MVSILSAKHCTNSNEQALVQGVKLQGHWFIAVCQMNSFEQKRASFCGNSSEKITAVEIIRQQSIQNVQCEKCSFGNMQHRAAELCDAGTLENRALNTSISAWIA